MDGNTCSWKEDIFKHSFYAIQGNDYSCRIYEYLLKSLVDMPARRTPKVEALVVNAIRRLQDVQGSTSREISHYISQEYDVPSEETRRQVQLALQRGLSYGIVRRSKGGYYTCTRDCLTQLPLGDGMGDGVMEPCPSRWRKRWYDKYGRRRRRTRRRRRRSRSRSRRRRRGQRRGRRRGKSRARSRRGRRRRRRQSGQSRRRRRTRRSGQRTRAAPNEMETESNRNDASKDEDSHKSETSVSERADEQHLQISSKNSQSWNTSDDV